MSSKTHFLTLLGFILLITGLILGTIGFMSNGPEELAKLNIPTKKELTFEQIKALDISLYNYYVETKESKDGKIHVSYQYLENDKANRITIKEKDGKLRIVQTDYYGSVIQLPLNAISQELSRHQNQIYIMKLSLPKGLTLDEFGGGVSLGRPIQLSNLHIKTFNYANYIEADNIQIDGGTITAGSFNNSTIKNTTINNYNSLYLTNTTLDNVTINHNSWITMEKSTLKNTSVTGEYSDFTATDLVLENSTIKLQQGEININNLTVKGDVTIETGKFIDHETYYGDTKNTTISLSDISHNTSNLDLTTTDEFRIKTTGITALTQDGNRSIRTLPDSKDKLIVNNQLGNITID